MKNQKKSIPFPPMWGKWYVETLRIKQTTNRTHKHVIWKKIVSMKNVKLANVVSHNIYDENIEWSVEKK
jgi:hypothetical protein